MKPEWGSENDGERMLKVLEGGWWRARVSALKQEGPWGGRATSERRPSFCSRQWNAMVLWSLATHHAGARAHARTHTQTQIRTHTQR